MSVTVTFSNATGHGSASPLTFGTYPLNIGADFYTVLTADSGYVVDYITINGIPYSSGNTPSSVISLQVFENTTIVAYFKLDTVTPPPPPPSGALPYMLIFAGIGVSMAIYYMWKGGH